MASLIYIIKNCLPINTSTANHLLRNSGVTSSLKRNLFSSQLQVMMHMYLLGYYLQTKKILEYFIQNDMSISFFTSDAIANTPSTFQVVMDQIPKTWVSGFRSTIDTQFIG